MPHAKSNISRLTVLLLAAMLWAAGAMAKLNIKAGDYYFDNSKVHYANVKLIVGNVTSAFSQVIDMEVEPSHGWWKAVVDNDLNNLDYYTFADTQAPAGVYEKRLNLFLDSLSNAEPGLQRTNLKSQLIITSEPVRWIYCPLFNIRLPDGYWRPDYSYDATLSGSLPVVYLDTQDSVSISSKNYYIPASLWIDAQCTDSLPSLGSRAEPLPIEVKGRGNWTWFNSNKKPYKVKFATKQSPLGLENSRHFILMAHCEDFSGYLRNTTGFELSRLLNMPYTPREIPVELVLNGEYMGLYFLCEKIRVESGRVDIMEQASGETIPDNATGGWLLELADEGNVVISQHQNNDPSNSKFTFVTQSPEELSPVQRAYIHDLLARADSCVYVTDKWDTGWEQILDIHTLARFYVIHEVMENVEAFSGSLFLYKDLGWDEKLKFGPVWDFDNSYFQEGTTGDHYIFNYGTHYPFLWIKEIFKFPHFQREVRRVWEEFCSNNVLDKLLANAWQWRGMVEQAEGQDRLRWHLYASTHGSEKPQEFLNVISKKVAWLNRRWGSKADVNGDGAITVADITAFYSFFLYNDPQYEYNCDVDGDGGVTVADLTILYNIILGY